MKLHKVSDAVGGKIKVVASSKTCAYKTVVKMFPFINAGPCFLIVVYSVIYTITLIVIFLLKMQIEGLCYKAPLLTCSVLKSTVNNISNRIMDVCCELRILLSFLTYKKAR